MSSPSPKLVGDFSLEDKIVFITGAGSGIGLAFAKLARKHGARIVMADIKLTQEAQEFLFDNKSGVLSYQCDVTKWASLSGGFEFSKASLGDVPDVVVPCAGIFEPVSANFWDDNDSPDEYLQISVNVTQVVKITRLAVRALVSHGKKGVICTIASQAGLRGFYLTPLYCATKHAVVGFVRSLAPAERLEGIKIVAICPGGVDTPIWAKDKRDLFKMDEMPQGTFLQAQDVAELMFETITQGRYKGGSIIEIAANKGNKGTRTIPEPTMLHEDPENPDYFRRLQTTDTEESSPLWKPVEDALAEDKRRPWP